MPRTAVARHGSRLARPRFGLAAGAAAIAAALVWFLGSWEPQPERPAPLTGAAARPAPAWQPISEPGRFVLVLPGLEALLRDQAARRHTDGSREDTLAVGAFETGGPHLRLAVRTGAPAPPSFFLDLARQGASAGIAVVRVGAGRPFATRLGPGEIADVILAGAAERPCRAFRVVAEGMRVVGWACDLPEAAQACLVDGLALADERGDPDRVRFADADRRDPACAPPRPGRRRP